MTDESGMTYAYGLSRRSVFGCFRRVGRDERVVSNLASMEKPRQGCYGQPVSFDWNAKRKPNMAHTLVHMGTTRLTCESDGTPLFGSP